MYMCEYACHMCMSAPEGLRRVWNPLALELEAVMNCLTWVLGTELRSFGRTEPSIFPACVGLLVTICMIENHKMHLN